MRRAALGAAGVPDCGTNYTATGVERQPWICEVCGGDVLQRDDDTPEAVNRRLDLYETQTAPLIEYYASQEPAAVVDGVGHPDQVFQRMTTASTAPTRRPAVRHPPVVGATSRCQRRRPGLADWH